MICLQGPVFFNEDGDRQGLMEVGQMQGQTLNQALLTEISNQCNTVKVLEKNKSHPIRGHQHRK